MVTLAALRDGAVIVIAFIIVLWAFGVVPV
jgi:hypothetical protein